MRELLQACRSAGALRNCHRPTRQDILRRSQRAWLQLVATQCELEAGPHTGGTDWVDDLAICDLEWRASRALMLESVAE